MKALHILVATVVFLLSQLQSFASNTISLSSRESGRLTVSVENTDPLGCVQFTLKAHGGKFLKVARTSRLAANGWTAASNITGDTIVYIVIYNVLGDALPSGKGECLTIDCSGGAVSQQMTVVIADIKSTNPLGGLVVLTSASSVIPIEKLFDNATTAGASSTIAGGIGTTANYPNPFNPSTTITFSMLQQSEVSVGIYDINGRLVHELAAGSLAEGVHSLTWDGKNTGGALVASGTYFARFRTPSGMVIHKMLLSK